MKIAAFIACTAGCASALAAPLDLDNSEAGICRYIVDGWLAAQGEPAEGGIYSYESLQEVEINNGVPKLTIRIVETNAGHLRVETTTPGTGTLVQAYDGRIGWRSHDPWGMGPMSNTEIQTLSTQARLDTAQDAIQAYPLLTFQPSETLDGRACYVVGATGREHVEEKWFFDKQTRERVKIEHPAIGHSPPVEAYFTDFRATGGLTLPYTIRIVAGGWTMTIRRSKIAINPPVDESAFVLTMDQLHEINAVTAILARHASVYGVADDRDSPSATRIVRSTIESSASGLKNQVTISFKSPHQVRYEVDTPGMGRTLEVSDGRNGWMASDILGFHQLKPAEIATLMNEATNYQLRPLAASFPLRKLVGERIVNGHRAVAVALSTLAGPDGTYYFDREAGRLLRYIPPRAKDTAGTVVDFSDFRVVEGVEMPFVTTVGNFAGQTVVRLQSIQSGVPLADDLFAPPPADH